MHNPAQKPVSIDDNIGQFPEEVQTILRKLRLTIRKAAPGATEAIRYQMPAFILEGNLVHFAAFKAHIGFYPTPSAIGQLAKEISIYQNGKGSIRFPLKEPIPFLLVRKIVKLRVKENLDSAEQKRRKK